MNKKLLKFVGEKAIYDRDGQMIFGAQENGHMQMLADVRGWGAIQNLFMDKKGALDLDAATNFQDELGEWLAAAINEKMERERKGLT